MRVHHLNCATLCPVGGRLLSGEGGWLSGARLVCHSLLVERPNGLLLVDAGLGTHDLSRPLRRLGVGFLGMTRPRLDAAEPAVRQIERLGFSPRDVRDIIVTHLDPDHAGGIADFPHARIHVHAPELEAALHPRTPYEHARYRPSQWAHRPSWVRHTAGGDRWLGFASVRAVDERAPEVLIVPLAGHTRGHAGVAVRSDLDGKWLLHAGDAYFFHAELHDPPSCPPGLLALQRFDDFDHDERVANQWRLRALARDCASEVTVFCAHDARELERCRA